MSEYSVEISGKYYRVNSQAILNEINNASTTSEKQEIISNYIASNKAEQINEDEYQEIQLGEEGEVQGEEEYPEGFDYDSYKIYANSTGISKLTEDSSLDDLIAIFEKIEDEVNELDKKIASLDEDNPDEIAAVLADMTNMSIAIGELGKAAGVEFEKNGVVGKAVTSGVAGAVAVVVPAYCIASSAAAISAAAVTSGAGTVAAVAAAVPVAGWVVAGIAGIVAVGAGIWAYTSSKQNEEMERKLAELQQNITNTADRLDNSWNLAAEKLQNGGKTVVDEVNSDLKGLLDSEFNFDDITDVGSITENIDKIIEAQTKLEPFYEVSKTYGIEIEGLNELMTKLGTGDDSLKYAQEYLDSYAQQVSLDVTDEVISDTTTLNTLYEDISTLIKDAEGKGLDTSKLEKLLEKIQETNQKEADTTAETMLNTYTTGNSANNGITGTVQGLVNGSNQAATTAQQVDKNSTQYETSTDDINKTSETLKSEAQKELDSYVQSISLANLSVFELEELYIELSANYEELKQIEGLDCSRLEAKLKEIRQTQQILVDEEIKAFENRVNSATTSSERRQLLSEISSMISKYSSISVSVSGAQSLIETLKRREEAAINSKVQIYISNADKATSLDEIYSIISKIQTDIQTSQSIGCDVSGYQQVLIILNQKLNEIKEEETSKNPENNITNNNTTTNSNNTQNNTTTNTDITNDNSVSNSNNSTDNSINNSNNYTDNSTTNIYQDNSTTNNNTDNSTNIGSIDNSTNVNNNVDTSKIEDILQEILDKMNKDEDTTIIDKKPCEPEDDVIPDNPNIEPPIQDQETTEEITEPKQEETANDIPLKTQEPEQTTSETNEDKETIIIDKAPETSNEEVTTEENEPEKIPDETVDDKTEDIPCEEEDFVKVDNSNSFIETQNDKESGLTSEETNDEIKEDNIEQESTMQIQSNESSSSSTTIIEGEDGYDYELDFEDEEK